MGVLKKGNSFYCMGGADQTRVGMQLLRGWCKEPEKRND